MPATQTAEKNPKPARRDRGPALLDLTFVLTQLLIIVGAGLTFGLSWWAGVSWWLLLLRTALAVAGLGLVAWALNLTVAQGVLEAKKRELEDREPAGLGFEREA
jgi:uncharacterized membrane protein